MPYSSIEHLHQRSWDAWLRPKRADLPKLHHIQYSLLVRSFPTLERGTQSTHELHSPQISLSRHKQCRKENLKTRFHWMPCYLKLDLPTC
jgi:hypothetical protein